LFILLFVLFAFAVQRSQTFHTKLKCSQRFLETSWNISTGRRRLIHFQTLPSCCHCQPTCITSCWV